MAFFKSNKGSAEIRAKIDKARTQLRELEAQVAEGEQALGVALAEETATEKILGALSSLKARADSLRTVITGMEGEHAAQILREEKERQRQAVAALADRFEKLKGEMSKGREKIVAAVKGVEQASSAYDSLGPALREILAACGLSELSRLIPSGAAFVKPEAMNSPDSNLRSVVSRIESAIHGAQGQREAVA